MTFKQKFVNLSKGEIIMNKNYKKFTATLTKAALILIIFISGCAKQEKPSASDTAGAGQNSIVGYWIAQTEDYVLRYHFHDDGHYHAHSEFHKDGNHEHDHLESEEVDSFVEGTYAVSGNAVTITVSKRITDCESKEFKEELDSISEIKFTYEFAKDGESWTASVEGFGEVKFVKDEEIEDWAEEHIKHND